MFGPLALCSVDLEENEKKEKSLVPASHVLRHFFMKNVSFSNCCLSKVYSAYVCINLFFSLEGAAAAS